ncbi:MAG: plasmid mobilization protein [Blautia faecis]
MRPGTRLFAGRTKSFFEHEMERGIKLSGVKKITVHCIRHSRTSMLVQMGFSPVEIAKAIRTWKVTTTIETYCHQSMDAQEKLQIGLEKWKEVRRVACKREDRFRHNTIAFWLSDEEKNRVEAKIVLSGISKGEYYRKAVLGQEVTVIAGNYMSVGVAKVLEQILIHLQDGNTEEEGLLLELVKQLLEANKNAPAGNKGIYE